MCWRVWQSALQPSVCNDCVKYVSTLEKPQEVIALNEPLTGASGLPLSPSKGNNLSPLPSPLPANVFI